MASFSKAENGTWSAQVKKNGIRKFKRGFETKRAAQTWALKTETDILEYQSDQIPNRPFMDAIQRYLDTVSKQKLYNSVFVASQLFFVLIFQRVHFVLRTK